MIVKCAGCEAQIEDGAGLAQPKRKWCSDKCRKRTLYSGECIDCGGRTDGTASGCGDREATRCLNCARTVKAERNERIFAAWEEGEPARYIAEREGMTENAVLELVDLYRRKGRPLSRRRRRSRELWPELVRLRKAGLLNPEIAERLATTKGNVSFMFRTMRRAGVNVPPSPYRQKVAA